MLPFIIFGMLPLIAGVVISFLNYNPYDISTISLAYFNNYAFLFGNTMFAKEFWNSMLITICFALVIVPILIVIPLALAYFVSFEPPGHKIFRAIFYLPSVVSITVVGILFTTIFSDSSYSLFNAFFDTEIKWLSDDTLRWTVILIASIWWQTGGNFIIFLAALIFEAISLLTNPFITCGLNNSSAISLGTPHSYIFKFGPTTITERPE